MPAEGWERGGGGLSFASWPGRPGSTPQEATQRQSPEYEEVDSYDLGKQAGFLFIIVT